MKTKLSLFLMSLMSIISPVKPLVSIAVAFIILDLFFGIWRSVKLYGWKSYRSYKLTHTVSKSLLYAGAIFAI